MMKIRILDRMLVALSGLILVALCAGIVGQVFFGLDIIGFAAKWLASESTVKRTITAVGAAILLILGLYCLLMLFRHRRRRDKFVLQKLESGDLAISLDTLKTMVQRCMDQHQEIHTEGIRLENQRDGLLVQIRGTVAGGISIPLTVDTLQKQIKQYVTACSGVEVKGIRIQIEASGEDAKDAPFAIEPPTSILLPKGGEASAEEPASAPTAGVDEEPAAEKEPEAERPSAEGSAAATIAAAESMINEMETEDDRPIHQRLFSVQEEPCIMPMPPEKISSPEPAENEGKADEHPAKEPSEEKPSDEKAESDTGSGQTDDFENRVKGEENA